MLAVVAATASASFTARNRDRLVEVLKNVDTSKLDHTFAAASGLKAAGVDAPKVGAVSSTHRLPGFQHNLLEQRNRQTDRQSVSQSDSQTVRQSVSQSDTHTHSLTYSLIHALCFSLNSSPFAPLPRTPIVPPSRTCTL